MPEHALLLLGPSTGGIRRHVAALADHLLGAGWAVTTAGPAGVLDSGAGWHHVPLAVPEGPGDLTRLPSFRRELSALADGTTLVHAHGLKAAWAASLARVPCPLVATVHNLVLREAAGPMAPILRALEGRLPGRVDHLIAVSEGIASRFAPQGRSRAAITVIPPAGPAPVPVRASAEVRSAAGVPEGAPMIVCVARLHPQKDLPTALAALGAMSAPAHLVVVGVGPDEVALRACADEHGVAGRVHWVGHRANVADELAAADAVLISSLWESGPLVLLEAMQLGLPVVSTPVGLATELVEPGVTGWLVPVGDHVAMAAALDQVLTVPAEARAVGARGRDRVLATFGPDELAARVVEVYRSVLS